MRIPKPPFFIRFFLGLVATALCLLLVVSLSLTIMVADVRLVMTDSENIKALITGILFDEPAPVRPVTPGLAVGVTPKLDDSSNGTVTDMLLDMLYDMLEKELDEDGEITIEMVDDFLNRSTILDFAADKIAGIVTDIYMGESTTTITGEELRYQLETNIPLMEEIFGVTITQEQIDDAVAEFENSDFMAELELFIQETLEIEPGDSVEGEGAPGANAPGSTNSSTSILSGVIADTTQIAGFVNTVLSGGEISPSAVVSVTRAISSENYLFAGIALCVILMLLICLCNYYQLPAGVRTCGIMMLLVGITFAAPTFILGQFAGSDPILNTALSLMNITMQVNWIVLGIGVGLIVLSIIWGIVLKATPATRTASAPVAEHVPVTPAEPEPMEMPEPAYTAPEEPTTTMENTTTDDICKKY